MTFVPVSVLLVAALAVPQQPTAPEVKKDAKAVSAPIIQNTVPSMPVTNDAPQTITINGKDFMPNLTLMVTTPGKRSIELKGNAILAPSDTSFKVSVPLATAGAYMLVVTNTDGGMSQPFTMTVEKPKKVDSPVIVKVTPAQLTKNAEPQELRVEGQFFAPDLRAIITDPLGADVTEVQVMAITPTTFTVKAKFEQPGDYNLVISVPSGATSNIVKVGVR